MERLRRFRARYGLRGKLQIHHVIPKQFRAVLARCGVDVDAPENLMFLPSELGARTMRLHPHRLIHDGGHSAYNAHVAHLLRSVATACAIEVLQRELRASIARGDPQLPWR